MQPTGNDITHHPYFHGIRRAIHSFTHVHSAHTVAGYTGHVRKCMHEYAYKWNIVKQDMNLLYKGGY